MHLAPGGGLSGEDVRVTLCGDNAGAVAGPVLTAIGELYPPVEKCGMEVPPGVLELWGQAVRSLPEVQWRGVDDKSLDNDLAEAYERAGERGYWRV